MQNALRQLLIAAALWAAFALPAGAQTAPNWTYGQVPTVAQWNAVFAAKQDYLGAPPLLTTGGTMTGKLVTDTPTTGAAGFSLPAGTAPTSPLDGDMWTTGVGFFIRVGGTTYDILGGLPAGSIVVGTTTITGGTNGRILRNNSGVLGEYTLTGSGTVAVMQTSPTIITPAFTFGTGAISAITGTSANTGFYNLIGVANSGTVSNAGTRAIFQASLTGGVNAYVNLEANGGASPSALLTTGAGMTGGLGITTAGVLSLSGSSISVTGAVTFSSSISATAFIPTGASIPTNGMYLSTTNTVAFAANSACEVYLNAGVLAPCSNDGNALGNGTTAWADLFLASGGVINWANGTFTLTHNGSATLTASGIIAASALGVNGSGLPANGFRLSTTNTIGIVINTAEMGTISGTDMVVSGAGYAINVYDTSALATGIGGQINLRATDNAANSTIYAAIKGYATGGTDPNESGDLQILTMASGTLTNWGRFTSTGRILFAAGGSLAGAASGVQTLPAATTTLAGLAVAQTFTAAQTIQSNSASALTVGPNGATNPVVQIDGSTASQAAGIKLTGAATGGTVTIAAIDSGSNANISINGKGSGTIALGNVSTGAISLARDTNVTGALTTTGAISPGNLSNFYLTVSTNGVLNWDANDYDTYDRASNTRQMAIGGSVLWSLTSSGMSVTGTETVTSASASALAVGRLGATTPAFQVDASAATQVAGIKITGTATGATVGISVIDSATNNSLAIDAKGNGTITLGNSSTGSIVISRALTYGGVTLSNAVTGTGNMVLSTSPALTTPNLGTPSALTLTNATGLPIAGITGLGTNVATGLATATGSANGFARIIATGTSALGTSAIASGACATVVTTSATGTATTDVIEAGFNGDPTGTTGYVAPNMLSIIAYPSTNNVNFKVCNNTAGSITPGAVTLNWRVVR